MDKIPTNLTNGCPLARDLTPTLTPIDELKPLGHETRKHPTRQILKLSRNIERFGFVLPILKDEDGRVVHGWALVEAAKRLELADVPTVTVSDFDEAELRALRLSLNRLAEDAIWHEELLRLELQDLTAIDADFELEFTGFEMAEIDLILDGNQDDEDDMVPEPEPAIEPVAVQGDLWLLDNHRIVCGDALKEESYSQLLNDGERVQMAFTDPPYNVPIDGHVCGNGKIKHVEFPMATGELSSDEFQVVLEQVMGLAVQHSADGAMHFWCMDWRHLSELFAAGRSNYSECKNLCVWNKTNAGMGSLYRSQHELVLVFKVGKAPHINNVQLGRNGRHRTNVWTYPGQTSFGGGPQGKLVLHPTVKPVALVADAIRDCSNRGAITLDPFGGSGTTLIAAERTGRKARLIEMEPRYVDVTIERWQRLTGKVAIHAETGRPFSRAAAA